MEKCILCGSEPARHEHYNGGFVCKLCIGNYFICPDCGRMFDRSDLEHADAGNGFCFECK